MYKLRFYTLSGSNKGNLDHEEYFHAYHDMVKRYREVFNRGLFALNPTAWRYANGHWVRLYESHLSR